MPAADPPLPDPGDNLVRHYDRLFQTWKKEVDLLEMARQLPAADFRVYVQASREQRARRRAAVAPSI
jgi:hypothetical protein